MIKKLLLACSMFFALKGGAQTNIYVDSSVAVSGSGTTWASAYKNLSEALTFTNAASTTIKYNINVAKGTYYPTGIQSATARDSAFLITRDAVSIYGGYPNGGGVRNVSANPVTLSGNIGSATDSTDNSYHIMVISGVGTTDTINLDGLIFTAGNANGTGSKTINTNAVNRTYGGGLYTVKTWNKVIVNNCVFRRNTSSGNGGGIYSSATSGGSYTAMLSLTGCTFQSNRSQQGGGLLADVSGVSYAVSGCTFSGNTASYAGGGIYSNPITNSSGNTQMTIGTSTFTNNSTNGNGGGLYCYTSNIYPYGPAATYVSNCTFTGNTAPAGMGGGLYTNADGNSSGALASFTDCSFSTNAAQQGGGAYATIYTNSAGANNTFLRCTFTGNTATGAGGGIYNSLSASVCYYNTVINDLRCIFQGNTAGGNGGAIYNTGVTNCPSSLITVDSCIITGNTGANGGAMSNTGTINITRSIISGNTSTGTGGGLYNTSANPQLKNCLISGNYAAGNGGAMYNSNSAPSIINCTLSGDSALNGRGLYNASPSNTGSNPVVTSSIIWEGASTSIFNINNSIPIITYSDIQGGYTGTGNISGNPLFLSPLAASAAPSIGGSYQLAQCSPAINAGLNSGSYTGLYDLAGNPRLYGTTVDQGAYEFQGVTVSAILGNSGVCIGSTLQLSHASAGGTWYSSTPSVATINVNSGLVTGVAAGTDTITYFAPIAGGCTAPVKKVITVNPFPYVAPISGNLNVCLNATVTLTDAVSGGVWSSFHTNLATVNSAGVVTPVAVGIDTIQYTYTNSNGCTASVTKEVWIIPIPSVTPISGNTALCTGTIYTFTDATPSGVWTSSTTSVATVDYNYGVVTPVATGTDTISYIVYNTNNNCHNTAIAVITVGTPPANAPISGSTAVCVTGTLMQYDAISGGAWSSSTPGVATINSNGLITPVAPGTTTISYTTNNNGCTSTVTHTVSVGAPTSTTTTASTCQGTPYNFGGQSLSTAGTYTHLFQSSLGCDSNVTLTLSVVNVNAGISQAGYTLSATPNGASYQWVDCANGNNPIPGATGQTFTPVSNGQYAVQVTVNGCTMTSNCKTITGLSINGPGNALGVVSVYPNPVSSLLTISTTGLTPVRVLLKDIAGRQLISIIPVGNVSYMDVSHFATGIYFVEVYAGNGSRYTTRVAVSR